MSGDTLGKGRKFAYSLVFLAALFAVLLLTFVIGDSDFNVDLESPPNNSFFNVPSSLIFSTGNIIGGNASYNATLLIDSAPDTSLISVNNSPASIGPSGLLGDGVHGWTYNVSNGTFSNGTQFNWSFTVDLSLPEVDVSSLVEVNNSNTSFAEIFLGYAVADTNFANVSLFLYNISGALINQSIFANATGLDNFNSKTSNVTNGIVDGTYYFFANASDNATNLNTSMLRTITVDTTLPLIDYTGQSAPNNSNMSATSFVVNVTITETRFSNATFYLMNGTATILNSSVFTNISNGTNFYHNFSNLADGNYTYNITAYDTALNINSSIQRSITLDTTSLNIEYNSSTQADVSNLSGSVFIVAANVTGTSNFANISFVLSDSSDAVVNQTTFTTTANTYVNWLGFSDGNYTYNITVTDTANNRNTTSTRTVYIDSTAPTVSASATGGIIGTSASISCSVQDASDSTATRGQSVKVPGSDSFVSIGSGDTSFSDTTKAGTYTFRCIGSDAAGNANTVDASFEMTNDVSGGSSGGSFGGSSSSKKKKENRSKSSAPEVTEGEDGSEGEEVEAVSVESSETWEESGSVDYSEVVEGNVYSFEFVTSEGEYEDHTVTVASVDVETQTVTVLIQSETVEVILAVGEMQSVDIDGDGAEDLEVTLNSISEDGFADITFAKLEGWVANEEALEEESNLIPLIVLIVILVLLFLAVISFIRGRKAAKNKNNSKKRKKK